MPRWFKVCRTDDVKPGHAASVSLYARPYAVFNVDGRLYGMDGGCAHMKANLASGAMYGNIVECAMHGWEYDVTTGECLTIPGVRLKTHPLKIEEGFVWIDIETKDEDEEDI
ncbi:MAG TPA: Rieske (2Fe-2S) protein [bacterium]|jgi:nitrite reductase/ring-hydroxylating ferredoxin subunit